MNILDYGSGIGSFSIEASKLIGPGGVVIAADISEKMLDIINKLKINNIKTLLIGSSKDIKNNDFDFILLIDVLHFIKEKKETIINLLKKLKLNGKLIIKFEHFSKSHIDLLLNDIKCSNKKNLGKKHWILTK